MITFKPLKRLLVEKEIKITDVVNRAGLAERVVGKIKNNEILSTRSIGKLCELLHCQPSNIISYEEDN